MKKLTDAERSIVKAAFNGAIAAGKSKRECYAAAIDALHHWSSDEPREAVAALVVDALTEDVDLLNIRARPDNGPSREK
jgi:hypothetical protein